MHFNKEIELQHFITGKCTQESWVPKCVQSCLGEVCGEIICSVFITWRETAVKQILILPFVLGLLTPIPPPRFCLVRAVNLTKWCKAMPASEDYGIAQKTFPTSISCRASSTRKTPYSLCFAVHFKETAWAKTTRWGWHLAIKPLPSHCCSLAGRKMMCCKCQVLTEM